MKIDREAYNIVISVIKEQRLFNLFFTTKMGLFHSGREVWEDKGANQLMTRLAFNLSLHAIEKNLREIYDDLIRISEFLKLSEADLMKRMKGAGLLGKC